jgi:methionyl-tRNA formyltransferase
MKKRVIVFGCQQIAVDVVATLARRRDVEIVALVTEERPQDKKYGYTSLRPIAKRLKLPLFEPERHDEVLLQKIKSLKPDLFLSVYYRKIFSPSFLDVPPLGTVNIHPGKLPHYRGPVPTLWALLNGGKEIGITLHYVDAGADTGAIIAQKIIPIHTSDTGASLNSRAMRVGAALMLSRISSLLRSRVKNKKQIRTAGSYYGPFRGSLRLIEWYRSSRDIFNRVRAMTKPFDGTYFMAGDKKIYVWECKEIKGRHAVQSPGRVLELNKKSFVVSTADGALRITDFTPEPGALKLLKKGKRIP